MRGTGRPEPAPAEINSVAWQPGRDLDLAEWAYQGKRLGSIGRGASWWIGDWVNYGNARFGEKYVRAAQVTGYDVQSLMNMAYVAARFDISRRREKLSWSHHAEVAGLTPDQRDRWLEIAEGRRLSVHGLREELRTWRVRNKELIEPAEHRNLNDFANAGEATDVLDHHDSARCPRCGYALQAVTVGPPRP